MNRPQGRPAVQDGRVLSWETPAGPVKELMRGYRLVDYLTQGYLALVAALILLLHGDRLPLWPLYLVGHAAAMAIAHVLIKVGSRHDRGFLHMLRCFYPVILYTLLYTETHDLDSLVRTDYLDPFFVSLEQRIFGCQPSRLLMQRLPYLAVSEIMHAAYFSYYTMVLGIGLFVYFRRRRRYFHYVTAVSLIFYVCYLTYIVLPVMGPHGTWVTAAAPAVQELLGERQVPPAIVSGPFFILMQQVYRLVEPRGGAAFPSSHVAVAIATLYFTFLYWRKMRWAHLTGIVLLCISTVYCGYHYAVDVIAGVFAAAVLLPVANRIYREAGEFELDEADARAEQPGGLPNAGSKPPPSP